MLGTGLSLIENVWVLLTARVIEGLAYGFLCVAIPRYQEEVVPPHLTSSLQPAFVVAQAFGCLASAFLAYCLPPDDSDIATL